MHSPEKVRRHAEGRRPEQVMEAHANSPRPERVEQQSLRVLGVPGVVTAPAGVPAVAPIVPGLADCVQLLAQRL